MCVQYKIACSCKFPGSAQDNLSDGYALAKVTSNRIKRSISAPCLLSVSSCRTSLSGDKKFLVVVVASHSRKERAEP